MPLTPSVSVVAATQQSGDPNGQRNIAQTSELPSGKGLAAEFQNDVGVSKHPSVVFADNFDQGELGASWDESRNEGGQVLELVDQLQPETLRGKRTLRVAATLGENTGGGLTKWFQPQERVFIRFYVLFDVDCDYVHHFCTLRANKSLQGGDKWSGFGGAGLLPAGDKRFSTALEPWGDWGRLPPPGRWNFYSYWHQMEKSPDGKYWGNAFRPATQPDIQRGKWICAEFMLGHNTPGQPDGEQAFWIDGELLGHWKRINWRSSPTLWANALTLESYVTDRWTKNKTNIVYFDNVIIASDYIGP